MAVSWSLSIEEWFYLLFPMVLLIVLKSCKCKIDNKIIFFTVAVLFALISFTLRTVTVLVYNPEYDFGVRKQIFLRMDAMMFGVILSGIKHYYKAIFAKISVSIVTKILLVVVWFLVFYIYIKLLGSGNNFNSRFYKIFLFSLVSLASALLVSTFDTSNFINNTFIKLKMSVIFRYISRLSYSLYLTHHIIFTKVSSIQQGFKGLLIGLLISFSISILLFLKYESKIIEIRDRITA